MRIFGSLRDRIARTRLIQSLARHWLPLIPIAIALGSNIIVWIIVLLLLHNRTELLGTGVLAYTYGLRHALDAVRFSALDLCYMSDGVTCMSTKFVDASRITSLPSTTSHVD